MRTGSAKGKTLNPARSLHNIPETTHSTAVVILRTLHLGRANLIVSLPSHLFFSLPRILYSLTRNKKEFLRNVLFLYSLVFFFTRLVFPLLACFFLYSCPRGAPEAPNERFPKVLQGFGLIRVSPAGRNVFFFTRPADAPWRRRNRCFPYGFEGFW